MLLGCIAGAIPGLFFHQPTWLGGYDSWQRRMLRLGHIAFFGLGFINALFALTAMARDLRSGLAGPSGLLLTSLATMSLVCYLSAWKTFFRHLFFIPALSATVGIGWFVWLLLPS